MSVSRLALPLLATTLSLACTPSEPPRWAQGGAQLVLPAARWQRGDDDDIEIKPNGYVYEDGDLVFVIDRVGRVVDENFDPVAIMFPDGTVVGTDQYGYGHVGITNASPPDRTTAWLAITPDGGVIFFEADGERLPGGKWQGCAGAGQRTCTLVTHMIAIRNYVRQSDTGMSVGVGVGVGVGY